MNQNKGIIIPLVLVFGTIFLIMLGGLLGFILLQHRYSLQKAAWNDSLHIAEAGVNYYQWHINHTPRDVNSDIQDGNIWCCKVGGVEYSATSTECQAGGFTVCGTCDGEACYSHPYIDPETNATTGEFVLKIKAKKICGKILGVYVHSTGFTTKYPDLKRTVLVKLASTSIGEYGSIIDEAVWRAAEEKTLGKFHTNQGMRMDAFNNSLVTSEVSRWICTGSFNCSAGSCPAGCTATGTVCDCEGVCGAGGPKDLWEFPSFHFNFAGLTNDLNGMMQLAEQSETSRGRNEEQHLSPSGAQGYHIILHNDGTFDIRRVNTVQGISNTYEIRPGGTIASITSYEVITNETVLETNVSLPQDCGLIFVEDNLWIEGTTSGKITIAAAVPDNDSVDPTIFIVNNLDYTTLDGSDSLALIAEKSVLITRDCAGAGNNITLRGVFVAQKGYFGRRGYTKGTYSQRVRNRLLTYGTIVSKIRGEVTWIGGSGAIFSGFQNWDAYFDEKLARDPPPLLPCVSEELETISWEEIQ